MLLLCRCGPKISSDNARLFIQTDVVHTRKTVLHYKVTPNRFLLENSFLNLSTSISAKRLVLRLLSRIYCPFDFVCVSCLLNRNITGVIEDQSSTVSSNYLCNLSGRRMRSEEILQMSTSQSCRQFASAK